MEPAFTQEARGGGGWVGELSREGLNFGWGPIGWVTRATPAREEKITRELVGIWGEKGECGSWGVREATQREAVVPIPSPPSLTESPPPPSPG